MHRAGDDRRNVVVSSLNSLQGLEPDRFRGVDQLAQVSFPYYSLFDWQPDDQSTCVNYPAQNCQHFTRRTLGECLFDGNQRVAR